MIGARRRERMRLSLQWPAVGWLIAAWVLLWGELSLANLASGLIVALVVLTVFPLPPIRFTGRVRPLGLLVLVSRFGLDLVRASVHVAALALRPGYQPQNAVIRVPLYSRSDLYLMLTAELLSLVPGSLLIESSRTEWALYLHILGTESREAVELARLRSHQQEVRVVRALGSDDELAEYFARVADARAAGELAVGPAAGSTADEQEGPR